MQFHRDGATHEPIDGCQRVRHDLCRVACCLRGPGQSADECLGHASGEENHILVVGERPWLVVQVLEAGIREHIETDGAVRVASIGRNVVANDHGIENRTIARNAQRRDRE